VIGSMATGITTASGVPLLASAAGQPGKDYTQTFTGKILAGSASQLPAKSAAASEARGPAAHARAHTNVIDDAIHELSHKLGSSGACAGSTLIHRGIDRQGQTAARIAVRFD
jgi:hypothetical protein